MSEGATDPRVETRRPRVFALVEDTRDLGLVPLGATLGEVFALSVGTKPGIASLELALSVGALRAIEVVEPSIAEVDYLAVAHVLACAIRHLCDVASGAPVIILAGDRGRGAIGPAVAERLALPHLGAVAHVETDGDRLVVERHAGARRRRYRGRAPVVLACVLSAPPSAGVHGASDVETLALDTLQITLPELRYRRRFRPLPGPALPPRVHVLASAKHLDERLQRDGVWAKR